MKRTILNLYTPMVYATNTRLTSAPSDPQTSTFHTMSTPRFSVRLVALAFAVVLLCAPAAGAQPAQLVKDIHPGADSSNATGPVEVGGRLLFTANDGTNGFELWKSDGTAGGTQLVKDINAGPDSSVPLRITVLNGTLYFIAQDGNGLALWESDGTAGSTQLVKVINASITTDPFSAGVRVGATRPFNGRFYFIADDGSSGKELWVSDGTSGGTTLLKDINPGPDGSNIFGPLVSFNGALYFGADDGSNGEELWKTDGTPGGTQLVKDINPGPNGSTPTAFTVLDGALYFSAEDGSTGRELWTTDGTASGTQRVTDINSGSAGSAIFELATFQGNLYFSARDGTHGSELWTSDGTAGGTQLFKEINPADGVGSGGSGPGAFTPLDGTLYFLAAESAPSGLPSAHHELWKTDGTPGGTEKVTEINSGDAGAFPLPRLQALNGNLVFPASDQGDPSQDPLSQRNVELWRSDGTAGGTQMVADINSGSASSLPLGFVRVGDTVFFTATEASSGRELWKIGAARLPVELGDLDARATGDGAVTLTWQTASETNNAGFRILRKGERGKGGAGTWTQIGFVEGAGTTDRPQTYRFTAEDLVIGTHQFRLQQVDLDGTTHLSDPVTVELQMQQALRLTPPAPNPVSGTAALSFAVKEQAETTLALYNVLGQRVRTLYRGTPPDGQAQKVEISTTRLPSGTYFLRLQTGTRTRTQRLTVVR